MKKYYFNGPFMRAEVNFQFQTYHLNGSRRINLIDAFDGTPVATVTAYLKETKPDDGFIIVKDYSENEGMVEWLLKQDIIESSKLIQPPGLYLCKLSRSEDEIVYGHKKSE